MAAPQSLLRASRPLLNTLRPQQTFATSNTSSFSSRVIIPRANPSARLPICFQQQSRRWQSSGAAGDASSSSSSSSQEQQQSWFKRMWDSPIGFKTVHFWAPVMKWALVLAGISDFARPAEKLSFTQNFALTCTGLIWTRWCFIIRPKNMLLAAVNFFLAIVGLTQVSRIAMYEMSKKKEVEEKASA